MKQQKAKTIYDIAQEILAKKAKARAESERFENEAREKERSKILREFKTTFAEILPLVDEMGINYKVCFPDEIHWNRGIPYIEFSRFYGEIWKTWYMDFLNATNYRYENELNKSTSGMRLDAWDMEGFILAIAENFPQE